MRQKIIERRLIEKGCASLSRLLLLFVAGFIALTLRYITFGEFEMNQLFLLLVFPVASVLILLIMKWQYNKDRDFKPKLNEKYMVTRLGDRVSTTTKQLYTKKELIGSYHRFYNSRWKRVVADIMDHPGQWYLNLSFSLLNGEQVVFKGKNENNIRGNNEWVIHRNNKEIGTVRTDHSLKNAAKLNESLYLEFAGHTYHYKSFGIGSKTEVYIDDFSVAEGKRTKTGDSVYEFVVNFGHKEEAELLFMVYILFNYQFGQ